MSWDETLTEQEERRARGQLLGRRSRIDAAGVVTDDRSEAIARGDLLASPGTRVDGTRWSVGDRGARFPPQSISKVVTSDGWACGYGPNRVPRNRSRVRSTRSRPPTCPDTV